MDTVQVQDVTVPALGLGTWQLTGGDCRRAVEDALEIGYRHVDTAQMYGNEADVGAGLAAAGVDPAELFVTTKIANDDHSPDAVRAGTEDSLRRLGLAAVDLLLIHHPVEVDRLEDTLAAMQRLRDEGAVRHLGVSNFPVPLLERALAAAELFAIQLEYHPLRSQDEQLEAARRHGLLFQAYSPLARTAVADEPEIRAVAREVGATPAQVALRWLLDQDVAALPKATSRAHLEENWGALGVRLDDAARERLSALARREADTAVGD